ncbi:hypothetical protein [Niallia sp. Krafla_26]|uniref:hypothetical protein n=1 Tax=Niallia sp. Krafla_26 TaxID=3064703 RepID=UPI003D176CCF
MVFIHFFESRTKVLTQLLKKIPSVDESIKIKGRKGKVINVVQVADNVFHVDVLYDPIIKKATVGVDSKKKKR